ncbi:11785_t:CDS:2 [Funneliformis mosseae]|uniref:11785_t:CDS:1 n=1 Tax=Funneliformis mosseae TaxID=27381 RepID=A0A9N9BTE8_FUNMO|nr:11785_t:CDS:2 [Funneliformis mosseae]
MLTRSSAPKKRSSDSSSKNLSPSSPIGPQELIFRNFRLRRIVKENHGHDINQLAFFFNLNHYTAPVGALYKKKFNKLGYVERNVRDTSNVLASSNIYDNEHCGDHLDIMSNFVVGNNLNLESGELMTCCWLHRDDDALLALGGKSRVIYIISIALSSTPRTLWGHTDCITDIQKHPKDDQHILSASKDATVRLWYVDSGQCLYVFQIKASVTCWHPSGQSFLTGNYNGEIRIWQTPDLLTPPTESLNITENDIETRSRKCHSSQIDCIRFANQNVISKSLSGKIEYWNYDTLEVIKAFSIKNNSPNRSRFDVSLDENFLCVGTSNGSVNIYNILNGKLISELSHRRSTKAVRCCAFSRDCKQVIAAGEDGYIWRYDYISDETLEIN